jgi:neurofibromin 1
MQLCQGQKRLEGGPDILFEICLSLADTTRKKAIFWPLQTMLLILCPDILYSSATPDASRPVNMKRVSRK